MEKALSEEKQNTSLRSPGRERNGEREESGNDVQRRSVIDDHIAEMIRQEGSDCMLTAGNYTRCDVFSPWMHEQNFISCWLQFLSQSTPTQSVRRTAALQAPPRDTPSEGRDHPASAVGFRPIRPPVRLWSMNGPHRLPFQSAGSALSISSATHPLVPWEAPWLRRQCPCPPMASRLPQPSALHPSGRDCFCAE